MINWVVRNFEMSKGLSKDFKKIFNNVENLKKQIPEDGGLAVLKVKLNKKKKRYIYYLVTKVLGFLKPIMDNLRATLQS